MNTSNSLITLSLILFIEFIELYMHFFSNNLKRNIHHLLLYMKKKKKDIIIQFCQSLQEHLNDWKNIKVKKNTEQYQRLKENNIEL